jgi:hypothetical protein
MAMSNVFSFGIVPALIGAPIILTIDVFVGLSYVLSMVRQYKKRQIFKNSLLSKIFKMIKSACTLFFSGKVFKGWTIFLLLGYGVLTIKNISAV